MADPCYQCKPLIDGVYAERSRLVALLCAIFPSSLQRHPEEDKEWDDEWRWVVYLYTPKGQLSWHLHDSDLRLFGHAQRSDTGFWDGHTTEEKYARVQSIIDGITDGTISV